jgi:acetyl-CoA carboxylase carboxyltransferase component
MHTRGVLIMTPDSAMVLTGKQSLDYSGGVSAEDNFGIGGYDRIMGPNGEAQYWAPDLSAAVDLLLAHYSHTYVAPDERFPRPAPTSDPADRDISGSPHSGTDFARLGEIFDPANNPERKKPFDIRSLLRGVVDADHKPLERWADMADAESAVVLDAHLGGQPVEMIGFESRPLPRHGFPPVDGPSQWTAGTLFPLSSKKTARAINAASGNRPLVILANLSGFDGSPESLRRLQLEYGAEIGRAVVNFDGPIVFCVVSRYHGGAFVVFSGTLNDNMEVAAVEGSYASVIGGAPAAAVVFAAEVRKRTAADPRVADLQAAIAEATASGAEDKASALRAKLGSLWPAVHAEKLGQLADEFDRVHSIERARQVGSVQAIVPAARLRPYLIDAVRRGMQRTLAAGAGLSLLFGGADQHFVDGDVPRAGDDVGNRVGDVAGLHPLPELAAYALEYLGPVVAGQFRRGRARLDQRDAYVPPGHLLAQRLAERADAELGQRVDAVAVAGRPARHRADVHHVGDLARAVLGGAQQMRQCGMRAVEQAEHVELHHLLPLRQGRAGHRAEEHYPGVVDECVQAAQFGDRPLHGADCLPLVGDVTLQYQRRTALIPDVGGHRLQPVPAPGRQRHGGALGGEGSCGGRPDATRSPGDQCDGAIQYALHLRIISLLIKASAHPTPTGTALIRRPAQLMPRSKTPRSGSAPAPCRPPPGNGSSAVLTERNPRSSARACSAQLQAPIKSNAVRADRG